MPRISFHTEVVPPPRVAQETLQYVSIDPSRIDDGYEFTLGDARMVITGRVSLEGLRTIHARTGVLIAEAEAKEAKPDA